MRAVASGDHGMALPREFLKSATGIVALTLSLVGAGFLVCGVVLAVGAAVASGADAHEGVRYSLWSVAIVFLVAGALIGIVGAWLWSRRLAAIREWERLQREGMETEGVILEVALDYRVRVNRKHPWRVRYEYQAGGSPYVGSEITWEKPDAYEPGAKVAVVYDAAKVYRSALKRPHTSTGPAVG